MSNLKPAKKSVKNSKFKDKEWYVSLAADVLDLKFATLAKDLGKGLNPTVKDTSKELLNLYLHAIDIVIKELEIDFPLTVEEIPVTLFSDYIIDPNFPSYHPVFNKLIKQLEFEYIHQDEVQFSCSWLELKNTIRQEFSIAFNSIVQSSPSEYSNAVDYINQLKSYSEPIESRVINHMNTVIDELENDSLAIDSELTLRKSYVTPSCSRILKKIHKENGDIEQHENLIQSILEDVKNSTQPIIIHGQPGHGKTSSVKVLVNALAKSFQAEDKPLSVLFYEFKNLRTLNDSIIQILAAETSFIEDESFFENNNTVLILDGLDERQLADGSDEILKSFVSGIFRLSQKINKVAGSTLNIILTGRSQYVGQIKSSFNTDHIIYEIEDFADDKIKLWLNRFNSQKASLYKSHKNITLNKLNKHHLQELMSQPILLSISSIMLCDPEGQKLLSKFDSNNINRTQIYKVIIQWSYEKRWQKSPSIPSINAELNFDEYLLLLQAIAFEMFKNGDEIIKVSQLASALQTSIFDLDFIKQKDTATIEKLCSQLRISFFFKGVEDKAFSFLHKSIKDFLIVSATFDGLISLLESCHIKKLDKEAPELYTLFGSGRLSSEDHIPMLTEWIEEKRSALVPHNKILLALWERISLQNMPIRFDNLELAFTHHKNVLSNFYQLISRHLSSLDSSMLTELFNNEEFSLFDAEQDDSLGITKRKEIKEKKFISLSQFFNLVLDDSTYRQYFSFKNQSFLGGSYEESALPARLRGHDFSNCTFYMISFDNIQFQTCNFSSAKFDFCWLSSAEFRNCNFSNSNFNCMSMMVSDDSYPLSLMFYNTFLCCDFTNGVLLGDDVGGSHDGSGRQYLFWDCNFKSASFTGRSHSTFEYSKEFEGIKLSEAKSHERVLPEN
mgnify:CR=1 FL=1|tara:strand:+ start:1308 stop:4001 length:2694 start_codon:yes stop_codon:yes gene_type:complete